MRTPPAAALPLASPPLTVRLLAAALCCAAILAAAVPAAAQPTLMSSILGFTDLNGNGVLDCGEPVLLAATFATNASGTPALTGTLAVPSSGTAGLRYLGGSAVVDPDLTVGCTGKVTAGGGAGDSSALVNFSCPPNPIGSNSWAVVVRYRALFSGTTNSYTAAAHAETSDGKVYDHAASGSAATACSGAPTNLRVEKTAAGPATPSSTLVYTVTVTDLSGLGAGGVELVDTVPSHTTFNPGASSPGWVCNPGTAAGATCRNQVGNVNPNGSLSRFFAVSLDSPFPSGGLVIANTACANLGPSQVAGCASTTTPAAGTPLLHLAKTLASGQAVPGSTLVFNLAATNTGNQDLAAVTLGETVPANTVFLPAASSPGWSCTPGPAAGAACSLALGALPAGGAAAARFAVAVADPLPAGVDHVANAACVRSAGAADACDSLTVPTAGMPLLKIVKTLLSGSGVPGTDLVYDLAVQNAGNQDAAAGFLLETVPGNTTFDPTGSSSSPGWNCALESVTAVGLPAGTACNLGWGPLAAGATLRRTFAVGIVNPLPAGVTAITNTGCAQLAGIPNPPPPTCDTLTTPTAGAPRLTLAKSYSGGPVQAGDVLRYTLAAGNAGNQDAAAAALDEVVPDHTSFVAAASSAGWACAPGIAAGAHCGLALGALAAGAAQISRTFAVRVDSPLPPNVQQIGNAACVNGAAGESACGHATTPPAVFAAATLRDTLPGATEGSAAHPGDAIDYTLIVTNPSAGTASGLDVATRLDPYLTLLAGSVTTTAGTVTRGNTPGDALSSVHLDSLAPGDAVTITFRVTVAPVLPPGLQVVISQADVTGANVPATVSDDPDTAAPLDPTATPVAPADVVSSVPTLGGPGLAALAVFLAVTSLRFLRRPATARTSSEAGRR
ncbi:MAG TPA: hypothetical protein VHQ90_17010 [Thermoanaerobaculia bacterium]|nr:hypothetical protein [Thermoanaerobaculia bacterium]